MRGGATAWATAVIGAAIVVLVYAYGLQLGFWADEYAGAAAENAMPSVGPLFFVAFLGIVLFVGGIAMGLKRTADIRQPKIRPDDGS